MYVYNLAAALAVAYFLMSATFLYKLPAPCWPRPCAQCMTRAGVGTADLAGKGSAAEIVLWCSARPEFLPNGTSSG